MDCISAALALIASGLVMDGISSMPLSFNDLFTSREISSARPLRQRRIHRNDLADDEKIEKHSNRGKVLLNRGSRRRVLLYICGDHGGIDLADFLDVVLLAPIEKASHRLSVCRPGVFISYVGGEKLNEPPSRLVTGAGDHARQLFEPCAGKFSRADWGNLEGHWLRDK